jgi:hypothetical protein
MGQPFFGFSLPSSTPPAVQQGNQTPFSEELAHARRYCLRRLAGPASAPVMRLLLEMARRKHGRMQLTRALDRVAKELGSDEGEDE